MQINSFRKGRLNQSLGSGSGSIKHTSHFRSLDVGASLVLEDQLRVLCTGLHLAERPLALALAPVVRVGEGAVEGAGYGVPIHAEEAVEVRVSLDVAAQRFQRVLLQGRAAERWNTMDKNVSKKVALDKTCEVGGVI